MKKKKLNNIDKWILEHKCDIACINIRKYKAIGGN